MNSIEIVIQPTPPQTITNPPLHLHPIIKLSKQYQQLYNLPSHSLNHAIKRISNSKLPLTNPYHKI